MDIIETASNNLLKNGVFQQAAGIRSKLPEKTDRRQQWQPEVTAVFEVLLTVLINFEVVVKTADVVSIQQIRNFDERRYRTPADIKFAADPGVEAGEMRKLLCISWTGYGDEFRLAPQ